MIRKTAFRPSKTSLLSVLALLITAVPPSLAWAGGNAGKLDPESAAALQQTMKLLTESDQLEQALKKDPNAKHVDDRVRSLAGSEENRQAIYEFAAEVFQSLIEQTEGNSIAAMQKLDEAMKNHEGFAKSLTPAQRAKLKELGARMPASQPKTRP